MKKYVRPQKTQVGEGTQSSTKPSSVGTTTSSTATAIATTKASTAPATLAGNGSQASFSSSSSPKPTRNDSKPSVNTASSTQLQQQQSQIRNSEVTTNNNSSPSSKRQRTETTTASVGASHAGPRVPAQQEQEEKSKKNSSKSSDAAAAAAEDWLSLFVSFVRMNGSEGEGGESIALTPNLILQVFYPDAIPRKIVLLRSPYQQQPQPQQHQEIRPPTMDPCNQAGSNEYSSQMPPPLSNVYRALVEFESTEDLQKVLRRHPLQQQQQLNSSSSNNNNHQASSSSSGGTLIKFANASAFTMTVKLSEERKVYTHTNSQNTLLVLPAYKKFLGRAIARVDSTFM